MSIFDKIKERWDHQSSDVGKFIIYPTSQSLFIDTDGTPMNAVNDIISKRDFNCTQERYSIILPGLCEWYGRYLQSSKEGFNWKDWHRDGLLFAKEIYLNMPRNIPVRYVVPKEDQSGIVEDFDVIEESVDSYLISLIPSSQGREPVFCDVLTVDAKDEEGALVISLRINDRLDSLTFQMDYSLITNFKGFLERIALSKGETSSWECSATSNGMYFFHQKIGGLKDMGCFQIYVEGMTGPKFSAYINARSFVRSIYLAITANPCTMLSDCVSDEMTSDIIECYINDAHGGSNTLFRKRRTWVTPAIVKTREFFYTIYEDIMGDKQV